MKVYVVIENTYYEGYGEPHIATIFQKEAMKEFHELVTKYKARKENYCDLEVWEYDEKERKKIAFVDFGEWNSKRLEKEWKEKNPGKPLPERRFGVNCSTC